MKNKVIKVNNIYLMKPIEKSNVQCNYDAVAKLHGTAAAALMPSMTTTNWENFMVYFKSILNHRLIWKMKRCLRPYFVTQL